jgi:small subunit ribosomal protein S8
MVVDPIADFINQIKNAGGVKRESVSVPFSKFKFAVAHKLKDAGYIKGVTKRGKKTKKCVEIEIAYNTDGTPRIKGVTRVSKPSRRIYERADKISSVKYGVGSLILSTPKGVLTDKEARKENVGGEALFKIW